MYYYDTYALYQIGKGESSYKSFSTNARITTMLMNLYELYYILIKEKNQEIAEQLFERLLPACTEPTPEDIKNAAILRLQNHKKQLSYVDALGYIVALRKGMPFLTGDDAFRDMPNTLFQK